MNKVETYAYGQGKVYLAPLNAGGKPGAYRWVGDVSDLSVTLNVETLTHKESYSGTRATVRKLVTGTDGEVAAKWHEFSAENLEILLRGEYNNVTAGTVTGETLPATIAVGDRIALAHQHVSAVKIDGLTENTDFIVDELFGAVTFLTAQTTAKNIAYSYGEVQNVTLLTSQPKDYCLRFEGVNLAEQNEWQLVELYKINFDPASALQLINSDNSLAALNTKAAILADNSKTGDKTLGRFGRAVIIKKAE